MRASHNPPLVKAFAAELKSRRIGLGISQEALALICGIDRTFIARIELAQNQPTLSVLARIAEGLEVPLDQLMAATLVRYGKERSAVESKPK